MTHSRPSIFSPASCVRRTTDHSEDHPPTGRRAEGPAGADRRCRCIARRRRHGAFHRTLSQGSHRRPGRRAVARTRSAAGLSARVGGAARGGDQERGRAGQVDGRADGGVRGGADEAGARRSVRAVQGQAPHEGADRTRGRIGAVGRQAVRRSVAGAVGRSVGFHQCRRWLCRCVCRARRRARSVGRTLGRNAVAGRGTARVVVGRRAVCFQARFLTSRQGRERARRRQVPRLLRLQRADRACAVAPRAGGVSRARVGDARCATGSAGCRQRFDQLSANGVGPGRRPHRQPSRLAPQPAPGR